MPTRYSIVSVTGPVAPGPAGAASPAGPPGGTRRSSRWRSSKARLSARTLSTSGSIGYPPRRLSCPIVAHATDGRRDWGAWADGDDAGSWDCRAIRVHPARRRGGRVAVPAVGRAAGNLAGRPAGGDPPARDLPARGPLRR